MPLLFVPKMGTGIATTCWCAGLGHVLHHHVAGLEPAYQQRALIADHWPNPIAVAQGISRRTRAALLAKAQVDAADNFLLFEQVLQSLLHLSIEQHVAIDLDGLFFI